MHNAERDLHRFARRLEHPPALLLLTLLLVLLQYCWCVDAARMAMETDGVYCPFTLVKLTMINIKALPM